jgi:hypothetical protein
MGRAPAVRREPTGRRRPPRKDEDPCSLSAGSDAPNKAAEWIRVSARDDGEGGTAERSENDDTQWSHADMTVLLNRMLRRLAPDHRQVFRDFVGALERLIGRP